MGHPPSGVKLFFLGLVGVGIIAATVGALLIGRDTASTAHVSVRSATPTSADVVAAAPDVVPPGSSLQADSGSVTMSPAPVDQPSTLGPAAAYAAYLKYKGGTSPYAVQPSYEYGLFTDKNYSNPDASGTYVPVFQNVPAWALIFHSVPVVSTHTGQRGVSNEIIFVDDKTGAVLEELTSPISDTQQQLGAQTVSSP